MLEEIAMLKSVPTLDIVLFILVFVLFAICLLGLCLVLHIILKATEVDDDYNKQG